MQTYAFIRTLVCMKTHRRRRPYTGPPVIQRRIPSRFENVTKERVERNRRGRALCEAAIKANKDP